MLKEKKARCFERKYLTIFSSSMAEKEKEVFAEVQLKLWLNILENHRKNERGQRTRKENLRTPTLSRIGKSRPTLLAGNYLYLCLINFLPLGTEQLPAGETVLCGVNNSLQASKQSHSVFSPLQHRELSFAGESTSNRGNMRKPDWSW